MLTNRILILLGTLLYPLYMFPFLFLSMLRTERFGYLLFSLCMGYLAYLTVPYSTWDLVRHYEAYEFLRGSHWSEIVDVGRGIRYYFFYFYLWIVGYLGFPKEFITFSLTFTTYYLYFSTLKRLLENTRYEKYSEKRKITKSVVFLGTLLLFLQISLFDVAGSLRNPLAFSLFVYAVFLFIEKKNILLFFTLSFIASLIHISVLPVLFIFTVTYMIRGKRKTYVERALFLLFYIVLITGVSSLLFFMVIDTIKPLLIKFGVYFPSYMGANGSWGVDFYTDKSIRTIVFEKLLKPLPFYAASIYFLFVHKMVDQRLQKFFLIFFVFIVLISVSRTLFDRYNNLFVTMFVYFFVIEMRYKKSTVFKKLFIKCFVVALLFVNMGAAYRDRGVYWESWKSIIYIPMPVSLLRGVEPNDYIIRHSN